MYRWNFVARGIFFFHGVRDEGRQDVVSVMYTAVGDTALATEVVLEDLQVSRVSQALTKVTPYLHPFWTTKNVVLLVLLRIGVAAYSYVPM